MSRDSSLYLDDMVSACEKILRFTNGFNLRNFQDDDKTYDAVVRNLEIIGEAAKHISDDTKASLPDIEWRKISGLRDVIAHAYFGIDDDILWDIIQNKIPELHESLQNLFKKT